MSCLKSMRIKAKNVKLNEECREVVRQMEHDGIGAVVIKGQSNWENYPEELREYRNPGDIDVWTAPLPKRDEAPCPPVGGVAMAQIRIVGLRLRCRRGIRRNMNITRVFGGLLSMLGCKGG